MLMQELDNVRHPVMYVSKKLTVAEESYSTIEKECLAIVKSVHKLREYLLGREFVIISHSSGCIKQKTIT